MIKVFFRDFFNDNQSYEKKEWELDKKSKGKCFILVKNLQLLLKFPAFNMFICTYRKLTCHICLLCFKTFIIIGDILKISNIFGIQLWKSKAFLWLIHT